MQPVLRVVLVLIVLMAFVCPFCKSDRFQSSRGLAVHKSACTKAQEQLRIGLASSRKRKREDDGGRNSLAKSWRPQTSLVEGEPGLSSGHPDIEEFGRLDAPDVASVVLGVVCQVNKQVYWKLIKYYQ
jgi:hypothetical protein